MAPPIPIEERLALAGLPPLPRRAWLEIDEDALTGNLHAVRGLAGERPALAAVVKADGYGHGLEAAARTFLAGGADKLCVATLDEALRLRAAGITAPIVVLFPVPPDTVALAAAARLELVVADESGGSEMLRAWEDDLRRKPAAGSTADVQTHLMLHLEIETGLSRGGVAAERSAAIAARILATERVRLLGIWSHLANADDAAVSADQRRRLERAVWGLRDADLPVPTRHLTGTGGLFAASSPPLDMVRPGLALYGLLPAGFPVASSAQPAAARLRPAMALKARAVRVHDVAAGEGVGYGGTWRADRPSRIATLPVGYGDGWVRAYAPGASVLVRGRRVPLVGTVAMDAVMADVTDIPGVGLADEFVFLGRQGEESIDAGELARLRTTIVWEVVAGMAQRLPRVYHRSALVTGLRTLGGEASAREVYRDDGDAPGT